MGSEMCIRDRHSIGVEVLDRLGGNSTLDFIVKEGDLLPKKVKKIFKTSQSLQAGKTGFIKIKLWEGEIKSPIYDNRYIGNLEITGNDFYEGFIPVGADLECEFEILDSGGGGKNSDWTIMNSLPIWSRVVPR